MITKFIEPWLLVPGNVIVLLVAIGVLLLRRSRRVPRGAAWRWQGDGPPAAVLIGLAALLWVGSTAAGARLILRPLEHSVAHGSPAQLRSAQAVVVLGGGIVTDSYGVNGERTPALTAEAQARLVHGWRIAREYALPVVVTGGRVLDGEAVPTEAEVAAALLLALGTKVEHILIEDRSRTTAENARFVQAEYGFSRVVLVTSAAHLPRSLRAFAAVGLTAVPAPTAFRTDFRPFQPQMLMPSGGALEDVSMALREWVGMVYYRLRGWG